MRVDIGEHNLDDSYNFYVSQTNRKGELVVKNPLSRKDYKTVVYAYCKLLKQAMLEGKNIILPDYLGHLIVSKKQVNLDALAFDYVAYNTTGEKLKHLNEHTDGFRMRILWRKAKCYIPGKIPYCFQPCRQLKRDLASRLKKVPNAQADYLQLYPD